MQLRANTKRRETSRTSRGLMNPRTARLETVPKICTTVSMDLRMGPETGIG